MNFKEIKINSASNGIKVKVGCMELVYRTNDFKQFFKDLKSYMEDPDKTEKAIRKRWGIKAEPRCSTDSLIINTPGVWSTNV